MSYTKVDLRRIRAGDGVDGSPDIASAAAPDAVGPSEATTPLLTIPCPLCQHVFECPFARQPRDECLDLWPLARPLRGDRRANSALEPGLRAAADTDPLLRAVLEAWEGGGGPSDQQYLSLRGRALAGYPDTLPDRPAYWVLTTVLEALTSQLTGDAIDYYGVCPADPSHSDSVRRRAFDAVETAFEGALFLVRDDMVAADQATPVGSHFERLFGDCYRLLLWRALEVPERVLPEDADAFRDAVESEWQEVLRYGNGWYVLSVMPRVSILDLIRYQELGGRDRAVSRSIAEYFLLSLTTFPHLVLLAVPGTGETMVGLRIAPMFEPLVKSATRRAVKRIHMREGRSVGPDECKAIEEQLRSVVREALASYDFLHGKVVGPAGVAGHAVTSASPDAREWLGEAISFLELSPTVHDVTRVNVTLHVQARLEGHLRTHYPVPDPRAAGQRSLDAPLGDTADTLGDRLAAPGDRVTGLDGDPDDAVDWLGSSGLEVPDVIACEVDGVTFRFRDEMARLCGVTGYQLQRWDTEGDLPAQRLGDVDPSRTGRQSNWRVYPDTPEMRKAIRDLAVAKAARRTDMVEGEYSRSEAAKALGMHSKTLGRWEEAGTANIIRRGRNIIYTAEEITRLAPRCPRSKV